MYELATALEVIGFCFSLIIAIFFPVSSRYSSKKTLWGLMGLIITIPMLIIGIAIETKPEVQYQCKMEKIIDAQAEMDKFLVSHPEFKENKE